MDPHVNIGESASLYHCIRKSILFDPQVFISGLAILFQCILMLISVDPPVIIGGSDVSIRGFASLFSWIRKSISMIFGIEAFVIKIVRGKKIV